MPRVEASGLDGGESRGHQQAGNLAAAECGICRALCDDAWTTCQPTSGHSARCRRSASIACEHARGLGAARLRHRKPASELGQNCSLSGIPRCCPLRSIQAAMQFHSRANSACLGGRRLQRSEKLPPRSAGVYCSRPPRASHRSREFARQCQLAAGPAAVGRGPLLLRGVWGRI